MSSSGFYVSPTGNDNNPGTAAAPFLTLAKAQQAMRAAPVADRTAYLLSGTYTVSSPTVLNSQDDGETWTTAPGSAGKSAVLVNGSSDTKIFDIYDNNSVQNLTFSNLTLDGGSAGGNAIFIGGNGNNIHVQNNVFRNHFNGSDLYIYNSDNVYFQNNTSGPNELQPLTGHVTDGKVHSGLFVTDNNISGFSRIGVELQQNSSGYFQNVHLDRNVVNITAGGNPAGDMVFSLVAGPSSVGNTVWGNKITGVRGKNQAFLELGTNNTSVENNSVSQIDWGISYSSASGSETENNTFTNDGPAFSRGGAYNDTQWVGVNTVNGVLQTGWSGTPNTTTKPVVWSPSAIASVTPTAASNPVPTVAITSAGGTVTSAAQTISGTVDVADAGSTVSVLDGTTNIGTATVSGGGLWSTGVTLTGAGANVLTATDTNAAGTGASKTVTYSVSLTATPGKDPSLTSPPSDFNDDGHSDILSQNASTGQVSIWEMNGTNIIGGGILDANPGPSWMAIGTGDFNDDGHSDILFQNASTGQVSIWEMNGTNIIGGGTLNANPGPSWMAIGTGDFNDDGHSDILFQNASTGQVSIWEMNGTSIIGGGTLNANPGPSWKAIGTGDFNADGHSDILWQNTDGQAAIWEMNGTNIIGNQMVGADPGSSWKAIGTGDFNADGHSDILWQNTNGQAAIWEMNGTNIVGNQMVGADPGSSWKAIGTGDFNADGHSDILWQSTSGQASIWDMNGTNVIGNQLAGSNLGESWLAKP